MQIKSLWHEKFINLQLACILKGIMTKIEILYKNTFISLFYIPIINNNHFDIIEHSVVR